MYIIDTSVSIMPARKKKTMAITQINNTDINKIYAFFNWDKTPP